MSSEADVCNFAQIYIAAGQDAWYDHRCGFDNAHWVRMAAFPDSGQSNLQIVEEWFRFDLDGTFVAEVHWRNAGSTDLLFTPKSILLPNR